MTTKSTTIELPSLLAFERKLEVSDGLMHSGSWEHIGKEKLEISKTQEDGIAYKLEIAAWNSIPIIKRQNRSTQSAYGIEDEKKSQPNPVAAGGDDANLPMDKDTLRLSFTLRIIGNLGKPFACNAPDFQKKIVDVVSAFKDENGLETLALRYAYNLANGRFLWRNRVCAEKVEVWAYLGGDGEQLKFDATQYSLKDFSKNAESPDLITLKNFIRDGLNGGDSHFAFLKVEAYAKLGNGQHVFPSQEMNMGESKKVLFQLDGCAAIHNVKIGNAIRTIDDWYDQESKTEKKAEFPIAVEPYGAVTQIGHAFRKNTNDLYTLLLNWLNNKPIEPDNKNYVVANLVRGGLFQGKNDDDDDEGKKAKKNKKGNETSDGVSEE